MSTLRPTFMGFDVAKRGIMTAQKGIDITGQNLVNWDSAGYTRQRVEQVAVGVNPYTSRYGSNRIGTAGQGVDILGIGQTRDKFLDARFRELTSEASYYD
ncbi:MAG: flagellar hook-associated protein FlgK, partial [Neglectibacter timonensis]